MLITGSTTGIGEAMARRFSKEGASVILHGRDKNRGERLANELGEQAAFVQADLVNPEDVSLLAQEASAAFGGIDALVNNAALTSRATLEETDVATFDRIIAGNLRAPFLLIKELLPELRKSSGCVVNIGSVLGHCGQSNLLAYSVSKGGLMTLTRNLADSLGSQGIRVNQLNVGWTLTDNEYRAKLEDGLPEDWPNQLPPYTVPSGKLLTPEDIAEASIYWVSKESRPISGSVLEIEQYPMIGRIPNQEGESNS